MSNDFTNRARLGVENLEGRELMSWGAVAPAALPSGGDRWDITQFAADGVYRDTDRITRGEVEAYTFTAGKTGTYTLTAGKASGSQIDTVIALYDSAGRRVGYNDDASGSTTDSRMTARLTAGRRYTVAVSNYNGTANGSFNLSVSEPTFTASASTGLGRIYSSGDATLRGTTLTVNLYGQTMSAWYYTDHYIQVRLLDANGQAIHDGHWQRGFRTAGDFVPGDPKRRNETWTFDASTFDLGRVARVDVTVGY